ncbi:type VI secretion system Vgr family protein [Caldimonas brevitalea]|uniref:Uncharacterized protein n=1 Tax=Caldimonas brevitalea TaxID=413882 RepID=A0A0G3BR64_9BURK|nr:type VI secretion system tip protein VgrG [Caldimonas brevitalea]AKJ31914.1 hypothetical protein AAW51_5223 [Caldimonas brevitalea]
MMTRTFQLVTPLGSEVLKFHRLVGREELARLSEFEIDALGEREDLDPDQILGQRIAVQIELPAGGYRYLSGHATRFAQVGFHGRLHLYRLTMRPWLWFLTRTANCRIFQKMKVPDILKQVFHTHGDVASTSFELSGAYRQWDYCVQYRESDFNFVSRLMEHEGIYYYFRHEADRHTLVLTDDMSAHLRYAGFEQIPYLPHERASRAETEHIGEWRFDREIQPGRYVHDNYDPEKPRVQLGSSETVARAHSHAGYEVYDYPDKHLTPEEGQDYARVRIEELQACYERVQAATNSRGLCTGYLFNLIRQPRQDQNREYLVLASEYQMEGEDYESGDGEGTRFSCRFTALPSHQPFRPARLTRKPIVQGPQTAVVVGPAGKEIHTDAQGRVKVRFHWDRYSNGDGNSSCWIRVSHPWAGRSFGMMAVPRVGEEVIVDFLEGDPDGPVVTGRVYNKEHMPPWALTEHEARTGIVTRSTPGGSTSTANELHFEDKKGQEEIFLHAERQLRTEVELDELRDVGNDRKTDIHGTDRLTVDQERHEHVKGAQRNLKVDQVSRRRIEGGEIEDIFNGLRTTVRGGEHHTVSDGGQINHITGDVKEDVIGKIDQYASSGIGVTTPLKYTVSATNGIDLTSTTGPCFVTAVGGVTINAPALNLVGGASVTGVTPKDTWFKQTDYRVTGLAAKATLMNVEVRGANFEGRGVSLVAVGFKHDVAKVDKVVNVIRQSSAALEVKKVATAAYVDAAIWMGKYGAFIIS